MKRSLVKTTVLCLACLSLAIGADHSFPAAGKVKGVKTVDLAKLQSGKGTAVSFVLTNGSTMPLNGVFYSEHVPEAVSLRKGIEFIDGKGAKSVIFEKSALGAVYPGMITYSWVFEESGDYGTKNPVPAGKKLEIRYTLTYKAGKVAAVWEGHCWAGKLGAKTSATINAVVGYCDKVTLKAPSIRPIASITTLPQYGVAVSPNPLRGHALLRLGSAAGAVVSLSVVNAAGQTIRSFAASEISTPVVFWNGCDSEGQPLATGVYWARLVTKTGNHVSKFHVVR